MLCKQNQLTNIHDFFFHLRFLCAFNVPDFVGHPSHLQMHEEEFTVRFFFSSSQEHFLLLALQEETRQNNPFF